MKRIICFVGLLAVLPILGVAVTPAQQKGVYVKRGTRVDTILATLKASGLPSLEGTWQFIGPFPCPNEEAFDAVHPPEKEVDLKKTYAGRDGDMIGWRPFPNFTPGRMLDLTVFKGKSDNATVFLYHEFEAKEAVSLPLSLGSDDAITVWLNGEKVHANNIVRAAMPDQDHVVLKVKAGQNKLLVRVGNIAGEFAVYIAPELPTALEKQFAKQLAQDFSGGGMGGKGKKGGTGGGSLLAAEAKHYRLETVPVPQGIVLEVGGMAFRPDGKLLACTRRGDVWLISNPDNPEKVEFKLFATGLHEALGLHVDGKDVYVVQRPELTKLVDRDGDDVADEYTTICDKWAVSGDYHEFAFGPAVDKAGNFFITLNVGFGGGHQSRGPWRGWCVKVSPKGVMTPWATGLRSPNGVNFSPEGDLFYCDNQGEWVATNKMHHIIEGEYYGHTAGLRWVTQSRFDGKIPDKHASGMLYDGQKGKNVAGMPPHVPPCIWFPYGKMGQSAGEPRFDTTGGKFGPFAGQCFVGDQTKSNVMRVALEKVNGKYQGACFPFRSGGQCGIIREIFAPDGSMYVGQTNRGWGSVGGKPYGLERIVYTGVLPFEIHTMKLTKTGFDLNFTKPLDAKTAEKLAAYNLVSFTYNYWSNYGSPEVDRKAEKVEGVRVSDDRRTVSLTVNGFRKGRVYELNLDGVRSADGDPVLHPEAYYTLNELP